uniref:transposase n=1 Tax=Caldicellulosiruptor obsidiansis TaxID=717609 RepID=UPI000315C8DB
MGKKTYLVLRKRRYICKKCGKKFFEHINFLGKHQRMTNRLAAYIKGVIFPPFEENISKFKEK